jgi:hypothetical protein
MLKEVLRFSQEQVAALDEHQGLSLMEPEKDDDNARIQ